MSDKHDDESHTTHSHTTHATIPLYLEGVAGDGTDDGAFPKLLVSTLWRAVDPLNMPLIDCMITVLLTMDMHLPENSQAREDLSKTSIIECLARIMKLVNPNSQGHDGERIFKIATTLMGFLISGGHAKNIVACYKGGAFSVLVEGLTGSKGNEYDQVAECAAVLKMLQLKDCDKPAKERLLDASSIKPIVSAMTSYPSSLDIQEWGCFSLKYIMNGWGAWAPTTVSNNRRDSPSNMGDAFLEAGAIDAIKCALTTKSGNLYYTPSPSTIREASGCIRFLAKQSPSICATFIEKGLVMSLGAAMQKWPKEKTNVLIPAQAALMTILTNPMS